jgi:hypothetical protein
VSVTFTCVTAPAVGVSLGSTLRLLASLHLLLGSDGVSVTFTCVTAPAVGVRWGQRYVYLRHCTCCWGQMGSALRLLASLHLLLGLDGVSVTFTCVTAPAVGVRWGQSSSRTRRRKQVNSFTHERVSAIGFCTSQCYASTSLLVLLGVYMWAAGESK